MLRVARVGEERLLAVSDKVAVIIVKHKHVGGARHDHLAARPLANHADAQRAVDVAALVKHGLLVSLAIAIGVFEHENPVALRAGVATASVVGDLADPDASHRIDINV